MILSNKFNFAFIHVPKTGGSSVTAHLAKFVDVPRKLPTNMGDGVLGWQPEQHNAGGLHSDWILNQRILNKEEQKLRIVAWCRNPFDRLVSVWRIFPYEKDQTFPQFVREYRYKGGEMRNPRTGRMQVMPHGKKQVLFGSQYASFLGRYESFDLSFSQMCEYLGIPQPDAVPHLNTNDNNPLVTIARPEHYSHVYDSDSIVAVAEIYAEDLDTFGYLFEDKR